jgi:hypothetical protein
MTMVASTWSRWITLGAVLVLALIAAVVSYSHMYELALRHGEPEWRAALFPLSVDGMIVGASMTLLSDARHGRRGGVLPWALLIIGSGASLAANVAVADPTMWSRISHAWPSFALIGAYELLMREFRTAARSVPTASAANEQTSEAMEQRSSGDRGFGGREEFWYRSAHRARSGRGARGRPCFVPVSGSGLAMGVGAPTGDGGSAEREGDRGAVRSKGSLGSPGQTAGTTRNIGRDADIARLDEWESRCCARPRTVTRP